MSWGERSCERERPCGFNPTMETCNPDCNGYKGDKPKTEARIEQLKQLASKLGPSVSKGTKSTNRTKPKKKRRRK